MSTLKIRKALALPGTLEPSTMYLVASATPNLVDIYISTSDGSSAKHVISQTEIGTMVVDAVANFNNILLTANITSRDTLGAGLTHNSLVLVTDATGDPTVVTGAALYFYDTATHVWTKVSEFESLDVVLTWGALQNKPTSVVADIDDAVTKRHVHANKALLDVLSDTLGELYYSGEPIRAHLESEDW